MTRTRETRKQGPKQALSHPEPGVGSLTQGVKRPTVAERNRSRAIEALMAADIYATRLVAGLREVALQYRLGQPREAAEGLAGAVSGIRCLAEILATVSRVTGVETPPSTDQELGRIALSLQRIDQARASGDGERIAADIEEELVPALSRLAPSFPRLESRLVAQV